MSETKSIDERLSAYFKSEVPKPWPTAPRMPADPITVAPTFLNSRPWQSRAALTASLLALLVGGWVLSGRLSRMPDRPGNFEGTTATRPNELRMPK